MGVRFRLLALLSTVLSGVYLYRIQHPNGDLSTVKTALLR